MTFAVHVKNSIPMSRIREKTEAGFVNKTKFEGVDRRDRKRYEKNFARGQGLCRKCDKFIKAKSETITGEHCSSEHCVE